VFDFLFKIDKWHALTAILGIAVATLLALGFLDRFYVEKEQLLKDPTFLSGPSHWKNEGSSDISYEQETLRITNVEALSHNVFQNIAVDTPGYYNFSFEAGVNNVVPARNDEWASGNITVIFRDDAGERTGSQIILALVGSQELTPYSESLLLKNEYDSVDFAIRLYSATGQFLISNPVVSELGELAFYKIVKILIIFLWVAVFLILVLVVARIATRLQVSIIFIVFALTIIGVMLPAELLNGLNQKIATSLPQSFLTSIREFAMYLNFGFETLKPNAEVSKLGHVLVFLCVGLLAGFICKKIGFKFTLAAIAVFALTTESLQTMVNGRTPSIGDLFLDIAGGLTGLLIIACPIFLYDSFRQWLEKRRYLKRQRRLY